MTILVCKVSAIIIFRAFFRLQNKPLTKLESSVNSVSHVLITAKGVSRFGLAVERYEVSKQKDLGSIPLRLSILSLQKLWSVNTVV